MFGRVFASHQKIRVLRAFRLKQKLNGKKAAYFVQYKVSTRQKKEREKKGGGERKKNLWIGMMKVIYYFGHFNV